MRIRIPRYYSVVWDAMCSNKLSIEHVNGTHLVTRYIGDLNVAALARSLHHLVRRHAVLGAVVEGSASGAAFVLGERKSPEWTMLDLSETPPEDRERMAKESASKLVWKPFAPEEGLLRAFALRLSPTDHVIGIVVHHFIADRWSMEIIGRELLISYAAYSVGKEPVLPEPAVQYTEYLGDLEDWLAGAEGRAHADFWEKELRNAPHTGLSSGARAHPDEEGNIALESLSLDGSDVRRLVEFSKSTGATLFLTLLAAKMAALACVTASNDIVVGVMVAGRTNSKLRNTVGPLANRIQIRIELDRRSNFTALVAQVRERYVRACSHQKYPYTLIEDCSIAPLFQFTMLAGGVTAPPPGRGFRFFDIMDPPLGKSTPRLFANHYFRVVQDGSHLAVGTWYLPVVHRREDVLRFQRIFRDIISIAPRSGEPLSSLDVNS